MESLPRDCLHIILKLASVNDLSSLFYTSKDLRKEILSRDVLVPVLNAELERIDLARQDLTSLHEFDQSNSYPKISHYKETLNTELRLNSFFYTLISSKEIHDSIPYSRLLPNNVSKGLLSGSTICKQLFNADWEANDVDTWTLDGEGETHKVDCLEEVIPNFDFSVVQCGILNGNVLLTPLNLYSFYLFVFHSRYLYTKTIVVTISEKSIGYSSEHFQECTLSLLTKFASHGSHHEIKEFEKCDCCARQTGCTEIKDYFLRLRKYSVRFHDYKFVYVLKAE
jgi:hypothetical protein